MSDTKICPSCSGENPTTMKFCGHCGSSLEAATEDRDSEVTEALKSFVSQQLADRLVEDQGRITEERRLVTALFADLSGFTPLADKLDPEELLEVIDPVINNLTAIVGRYEGYVDKFAGDALLAFFGAPIAHEDDAERALLVALEMHKELARIIPDLPEDARGLTLHAGVNTGHVIARVLGTEVRMDYSVLGDAVILAQRLESAAPAGTTYVGSVTHLLTRDRFEFAPVGELTLKGKAEPVPAWKLIGAKQGSGRSSSPRFVGRVKELETARLVLDGATKGSGAVISVTGEPGVGKTRLTREIQRQARERGVLWLTGRCLSYGSAIPYWPFADLFRSLFGIAPDEPHDAALPRIESVLRDLECMETMPYLARLLGLPSPDLGPLDPETYRDRLHGAVKQVLTCLSARMPTVVAIEDLHWGDSSSVSLVTDVTSLCSEHPIVLYLTARVESVPVLVEIASEAPEMLRHAFRLERFTQAEIDDLVASLLGEVPPRVVLEAIAERSAGNAFFAEELLRAMQDGGQLIRTDDGWKTDRLHAAALPPTVEGVLSSRIDLLPRRTAAILQDASVIGRRVRIPILRELEEDAVDLDRELEALIDGAYLERGDRHEELVFHHALVQEAAYSRLLRKQRRELHRKVADIAESLYGAEGDTIDLLARHLYLGQAGAKAIDYLVKAGERSKSLFANEEAILHFSRAAEVARTTSKGGRDRSELDEILLKLGELHELRGQYEDAATLYEEVKEESGDVRAWRGLASTLRNQSRYGEVHELLELAFANDFSERERSALLLERGWTLVREGSFEEASMAFLSGLQHLVGSEDLITAELLLQLAGAETALERLEPALDHAQRAVKIFERHDHVRGQASAMRIIGDAYRELQRYEEAAGALQRGIELSERVGSIEEIGGCLINLGRVEMDRDNMEAAIDCDRRAVEAFEQTSNLVGRAIAYGNLAEKLVMVGQLDEAHAYAVKARELSSDVSPFVEADANRILAEVYITRGDFTEGAELAERAAALALSVELFEEASETFAMAAEAYANAGLRDRASEMSSKARSVSSSAAES